MFHASSLCLGALERIGQQQELRVLPLQDHGPELLVPGPGARHNQKMIRRLREVLSGIPGQDFGTALFYLLLAAALQSAGLRWFGGFEFDLFPGLELWPAALLLGSCGIALRSTRPAAMIATASVAAVLLTLDDAGIAALLLLFEVIFTGTRYAGPRLSRATRVFAVAISALSVLAAAFAGNGWQPALIVGVQAVVAFLTPMWWAANVRQQEQIAEVEQQRARQAELMVRQERELSRLDLQLSVARERGKMARDLHDVIAGRLSAIALQSEAALRSADPALRGEVLRASRETSLKGLADMRQMIDVLHTGEDRRDAPGSAGGLDLGAELRALAEASRAAGNPVELLVRIPEDLGSAASSTLYRISQEALTNANKHAPGQPVTVRLDADPGAALLTVENPLVQAAESGNRQGYGLANMAVRAAELGGSFSADAAGDRWRVAVRLPR
ncbi:MAG: hypothetical protein IIZ13_10220 [Renibacterium sp.]|nr:hypothetical protein [Renibacterium sp.]